MKKLIHTTILMKTGRSLFFGLILSAGIFSCESALDAEADNTISGDVLTNQAAIEQALVGAYYNAMGIYDGGSGGELLGGDFKLIATLLTRRQSTEIAWDEVNAPTYVDFIDKDVLLTNIQIEQNWRRAYEVINALNGILANIDNVDDATAKNRIQGEAMALRAILYFEMVRLWGPQYADGTLSRETIPLITTPFNEIEEITTPVLATVGDVYGLVEADLTSASTLLQPFGKNGTSVSYYACQAYLMKLSLQKNDYVNAESFANEIITSGQFSLLSSPLLAFNNNSNSSEDIFAVQQTAANTTGDRSTGTGLANHFSSLTESGLGTMRILEFSIYSGLVGNGPMYSDSDVRATVDTDVDEQTRATEINTAFYTNVLNTNTISCAKFLTGDKVIPIVRLSEIHLYRAEALFEQNIDVINPVALGDLNAIRTRAGLTELQATDFADSFAFYDSLMVEISRELLYEGAIFHDLKRRKANDLDVQLAGSDPLDNKFILPIPQAEVDTWTD